MGKKPTGTRPAPPPAKEEKAAPRTVLSVRIREEMDLWVTRAAAHLTLAGGGDSVTRADVVERALEAYLSKHAAEVKPPDPKG